MAHSPRGVPLFRGGVAHQTNFCADGITLFHQMYINSVLVIIIVIIICIIVL